MHPNEQLITDFYEAFARGDADTMAASYGDAARFSDPVFRDLDAGGVRAMWRMLTSNAADLRLEFSHVSADDRAGQAHWEAWYTFSATGRKVHNVIDARFEFGDGKIVRHTDVFDFWRWSRQALGPVGLVLGWTPLVQKRVRSQATSQLQKWRQANE